jgi:hypothetical protein
MKGIPVKVYVNEEIHEYLSDVQSKTKTESGKKTALSEILLNFALQSIERKDFEQGKMSFEQENNTFAQGNLEKAQNRRHFAQNKNEICPICEQTLSKKLKKIRIREAELHEFAGELDEIRHNLFAEQTELVRTQSNFWAEKIEDQKKDIQLVALMQENQSLKAQTAKLTESENSRISSQLSGLSESTLEHLQDIKKRLRKIEAELPATHEEVRHIGQIVSKPAEKSVLDYLSMLLPAILTVIVTIFMKKKESQKSEEFEKIREIIRKIPDKDRETVLNLLGKDFGDLIVK